MPRGSSFEGAWTTQALRAPDAVRHTPTTGAFATQGGHAARSASVGDWMRAIFSRVQPIAREA